MGVEEDRVVAALPGEFRNVGQGAFLRRFRIIEQGAGGPEGHGQLFRAKATQVPRPQLLEDCASARFTIKLPGRPLDAFGKLRWHLSLFRNQDFRRLEPSQLRGDGLPAKYLRDHKAASGEIEPSEAVGP